MFKLIYADVDFKHAIYVYYDSYRLNLIISNVLKLL